MVTTSPLTVRLPESVSERREAVEAHLDCIEWEQEILSRSEDIRSGREIPLSLDEVRKSLGLGS